MVMKPGKFTVELETENVAAWMAINNTFAWAREEIENEKRYWSGVLIQLGQYVDWEDGSHLAGFLKIEYLLDGKPTGDTIGPDAFNELDKPTWINIVVRKSGSDLMDPMTRGHVEKLRIAPAHSLDKFLSPKAGGITLWSENGYELQVKNSEKYAPHKTYTFTTGDADEYRVDIYRKGSQAPDEPREFNGLKIHDTPCLGHGSHNSPPNEP
jgi:hypothetical protein